MRKYHFLILLGRSTCVLALNRALFLYNFCIAKFLCKKKNIVQGCVYVCVHAFFLENILPLYTAQKLGVLTTDLYPLSKDTQNACVVQHKCCDFVWRQLQLLKDVGCSYFV